MLPSSVRVFAIVRRATDPFNSGKTVEVKFSTEPGSIVDAEIYVRMSPERAKLYKVGSTFILRLDEV